MTIGRNDPCHCGSGKKYKKCCWAKDQKSVAVPVQETIEEDHLITSALPVDPVSLSESDELLPEEDIEMTDPLNEAIDAFYDEFTKATYEQKLLLVEEKIQQQSEVLVPEIVFEVFHDLFYDITSEADRTRFDALVALLKAQLPAAYEAEAHYLLSWQIENGIVTGKTAVIPTLFAEMAKTAGNHLDEFYASMYMLAYHGYVHAISSAMRQAWPHIKESGELVPWAADEFSEHAVKYEIFAALDANPNDSLDDEALRPAILNFIPTLDEEVHLRHITLLGGERKPTWELSDFAIAPSKKKESDPVANQLYDLSLVFLRYLWLEENFSLAKGEMARQELFRYIMERRHGELTNKTPESRGRSRGKKRSKQSKKRVQNNNPLIPDKQTLDPFLAQLIGFMSRQQYVMAATFEAIPAWLRFLEREGLATASERETALKELKGLANSIADYWENYDGDMAPRNNALRWPDLE